MFFFTFLYNCVFIYEKFIFFMVLKHSHWMAMSEERIVQYAWLHTLNHCLTFGIICEFVIFIHTPVLKTTLFQQKGKIQSMDDTITIVKSPCTRQENVFIWKARQARNYMNNLSTKWKQNQLKRRRICCPTMWTCLDTYGVALINGWLHYWYH